MKAKYKKEYMRFGFKVATYRRMRKMTQEALGNAITLDASYISRIERGAVGVSYDRILDLAYALDIKPALLLDHDDILEVGQRAPEKR